MYASKRQQRFFHTATARAAGITPAMTKEYDEKTKGHYGQLPEIAPKKKRTKHSGH